MNNIQSKQMEIVAQKPDPISNQNLMSTFNNKGVNDEIMMYDKPALNEIDEPVSFASHKSRKKHHKRKKSNSYHHEPNYDYFSNNSNFQQSNFPPYMSMNVVFNVKKIPYLF